MLHFFFHQGCRSCTAAVVQGQATSFIQALLQVRFWYTGHEQEKFAIFAEQRLKSQLKQ